MQKTEFAYTIKQAHTARPRWQYARDSCAFRARFYNSLSHKFEIWSDVNEAYSALLAAGWLVSHVQAVQTRQIAGSFTLFALLLGQVPNGQINNTRT